MFDVAFSEILIIALVALIVIGPEKLPKVARTVGHLTGRLQRYVNTVKGDIERELHADELRRIQQNVRQEMAVTDMAVREELQKISDISDNPEDRHSSPRGQDQTP